MRIPIPEVQRQVAPTPGASPPLARAPGMGGVMEAAELLTRAAQDREARAAAADAAMDQARASEKVAQAELDWTKAEIERRSTFDPASGKPHAEQVRLDFDAYIAKAANGATTNAERELLRARLGAMRSTLVTRAMAFEASTRQKWRRDQLEATAGTRAAAAALDPEQALALIAEQFAEINTSPDLAEIERMPMRTAAAQRIAGFAAQTLATRDPEGLQAHPVFKYLAPESVPEVLRLAGSAQRLAKTQAAADTIMARSLPMDEAMRLVEREHSGEDERALKIELQGRYAVAEAGRREREQDAYGTAQLEVERAGRVTPATWARLTDAHRAAILNRQQAEARQRAAEAAGRPVKTDPALYLQLREQADADPQGFARLDLKLYADRLALPELKQLADLRQRQQAGPRESTTLTQQMNATMQAVGIRKPEQRGHFLAWVQGEVDDATAAKGKPLTFDERQAIIDRGLLQGPDPDRWLPWGTKRAFQLTPEQRARFTPDAPNDAPATEREALNEALRQQGLAETPANRLKLYSRATGGVAR